MPEQEHENTEVEETTEDVTEAPQGDEQGEGDTELSKVRKEAAERRVALRETEAERDSLREQVQALALRLGGQDFLSNVEVLGWSRDFESEDGTPNLEAIAEAAQKYAAEHPHAAKVRGDVGQGHRGAASESVNLADMLRSGA